jgi:hypothetical protein
VRGIRDPIAQSTGGERLVLIVKTAALVVKECSSIRCQVLEIPNLWQVDGWVIDLCYNSLCNGEPESARSRKRGPNPIFIAPGPSGCNWNSEGRIFTGWVIHDVTDPVGLIASSALDVAKRENAKSFNFAVYRGHSRRKIQSHSPARNTP